MIYKLGKIGVGEGMALIAMLLLPNIYLSEPSLDIGFVGSSAWLLKIVSGIVAMVMLLSVVRFYQTYIERFHGGKLVSFYDFLQTAVGRRLALAMFLIWAVLFELQTILTLREFADYVLITTLPSSRLAILLFIFAATILLLLYRGLEILLRVSYLLFAIAMVGILLMMLLLLGAYEFSHLFPWQGYGLSALARHSVCDLGTWVLGLAVLIVMPNLQNLRTIKKAVYYGFGYTIALKSVVIAAAIMIFGVIVAPERALLFYEIVQTINLSQYFQRVEAIFVILWLTGGLLSAALMQYFSLTMACQPLKVNDMTALIPLAVLMSAAFALLPSSAIATIELNRVLVYRVENSFMLVSFAAIMLGYYKRIRRAASCAGVTE